MPVATKQATSKHTDIASALAAAGYTLESSRVAGEPTIGTVTVALSATKAATLTGATRNALEALGCTGVTVETVLTCTLPLSVSTAIATDSGHKRKLTTAERLDRVRGAIHG